MTTVFKAMRMSTASMIFTVVVWQAAAVSAAVEGRVYLDSNRNGQADAGEPGVAHVAVSDGLRVAVTDAAGGYRLETSETPAIVWISVPRDHEASGAFWHAANGKSREDFGLVPRPQAEDFTFVQITDSHIGRDDLLKKFAKDLCQLPVTVAFVVNTGDLVGGVDVVAPEKAKAQFDRYLGAAAAFRQPLYQLPGNHEHVAHNFKGADLAHPFYGKGLYRQLLGPTYYSWNWAGVHCVALDGTTLPYQERLGTNQLTWLKADLESRHQAEPLILFCHQSLPDLKDAGELAAILKGHSVLAAFCGHLHRTFTTQFADFPVYQTGALSGAWWSGPNIDGTPQGFRLTQVKGGKLKTVYTSREGLCPISIVAPLATAVQSGQIAVEVAVVDFGQPVDMAASFVGNPVPLTQGSREDMWSIWRGVVDTRQAFDGDRKLRVMSKRGEMTNVFEICYLVANGRTEAYAAAAPATLKVQVRGIRVANEILLNGAPLGVIPAGTTNETTLAFDISKTRLEKCNRVTVRAAHGFEKNQFSVGPVWMDYKGKRISDLRYASFERHVVFADNPQRCEKDLFFCLP